MMDALRMMALLGVLLWMIPVIWPNGTSGDAAAVPMSRALFYVFGVWILLILLAAGMVRLMSRDGMRERDDLSNGGQEP
jgi:bacteriorhodopsin